VDSQVIIKHHHKEATMFLPGMILQFIKCWAAIHWIMT